jgi:uncharacterized protein (TIGR02145 family)/uncharacterized repeat protein (TIGR02543 family)
MKKSLFATSLVTLPVLLLSLCALVRDNPLDPEGINYVPPAVTLESVNGSAIDIDTIHFDTASIVVVGNRAESRFQAKIDSGAWSGWQTAGRFSFELLTEGKHTVSIQTKYEGGDSIIEASVVFTVQIAGYKPFYITATDTTITTDTGKSVTIIASPEGRKPITRRWMKGTAGVDSATTDTFLIAHVTFADSGSYTCIAANEWGKDTSRIFHLKIVHATVPTFAVTYYGNSNTSGSVPTDANTYASGSTVTVKANTGALVRTGYIFAGWNTAAAGTGSSYAGSDPLIMGTVNVILFAKWTQNPTYTVTYDGNGNTAGSAPTDANAYEQGTTVTVKANSGALAKTGYTFAGWNTLAAGSGTSYAGSDPLTIGTANITLYAKWTQNPTYTVTYIGNGNTAGSAPNDVNVYEQGATVIVKANTGALVRTGYTFTGWNTAAAGTGISYAGSDPLAMGTANVTLFAKWTQNATFSVTYNGNGNTTGAVPVDANAYEQGATVTAKANTGNIVRTGYTFARWNTLADGTGTSYAAGEPLTMGTANVTLYAQWTLIPTYTVTYTGNGNTGGTVPTDANAYEQGATVAAKANTGSLVKTGYTFAGWNTNAGGTGTAYAGSDPLTMGTASVTLYAKWTQNATFSVTYSGNGNTAGTAPTDANVYEQGAMVTVKAITGSLVKTGYTFAGWNTNAGGTGTSYAGSDPLTMGTANVTLYAKWTQNAMFSVTYSGNGNSAGTIPTDATTYEQGASVTVKANTGSLVRTGYSFAGWNTAAGGAGTPYTAGATFTIGSADVTLYAQWTIISTYTVTYTGNGSTGGTVPTDPNAYTQSATVTVLGNIGNLVKTGFTFAGWNTAADGTGITRVTGETFTINAGNVTLFAKWTPVYSVTYTGNGSTSGTVPVDPNNYTNGYTVTVLENTGSLAKTGFAFDGWNTNAAGSGTSRPTGSTFAIGSVNVVLYAKWIATYTVTFDGQGATTNASPTTKVVIPPAPNVGTFPTPPLKTGYIFDGWYTGVNGTGSPFNTSTPVNANITVYAKWVIRDPDGNEYTAVTIGTQTWMVENLKTTKLNDGTAITNGTDPSQWNAGTTPLYCWLGHDESAKPTYGALYNWVAVNTGKLAPVGWHVPTATDWHTLATYLGGDPIAGGKLKEQGTEHWMAPNTTTTENGFKALPGGMYMAGSWEMSTVSGLYWGSTLSSGRLLYYNETYLNEFTCSTNHGYSVRLIKD